MDGGRSGVTHQPGTICHLSSRYVQGPKLRCPLSPLSERHVRRLLRAFEAHGARGLLSERRGRVSANRIPKAYEQAVIDIVRDKYADFGPTFAHQKLVEQHDARMSVETLRKWMIRAGIWQTRAERRKRIQRPRYRRDCLGELIQIDGSDHHCFEDRAPRAVLLVYVDHAASKLMEMHMFESTYDVSSFSIQ